MKAIGIIPARMGSTRFPNKPLVEINGMPMIGHCYHRTVLALGAENTFVATCDDEIKEYVESIGGSVVMTSAEHTRATTRTAEAMEKIGADVGNVDIVIMVQGDEPVISPEAIKSVVPEFGDKDVEIANIMCPFTDDKSFHDKNNVKVVFDKSHNALYFSREPIPSKWQVSDVPTYMQTGIMAFRPETLLKFNATPESSLEIVESVDMNRVLENGGSIRMLATDSPCLGVDTPEDLLLAEQILKLDTFVNQYSLA